MNIYQRINAVMKEVEYVRKDAVVQGYKAVTHDMVTSVLRKTMVSEGIVIQLEQVKSELIEKRDKAAGINMHLYSGDYLVHFVNIDEPADKVTIAINAHAQDNGDKAPGKCASYATKYAMLKLFSLETGENDESRAFEPDPYTEIQKSEFDSILDAEDKIGLVVFSQTVGPEVMTGLVNSFPKGAVSSGKQKCRDLEKQGWEVIKDYATQLTGFIDSRDDTAALQLAEELTGMEKTLVAKQMDKHALEYLRKLTIK